jgi:PAS domain S-box-containing protein
MSKPDSVRWLQQSMFLNYGVAVLSVTAAQFIAQWLQIQYDFEPLVPFLCAIMFSAWFGGVNPGLLAVALSLLAFHYYFLIPMYPLGMEKEIPRLLFAALISGFIVVLSAAQRSAMEALRESEQRYHSLFDNMAEGVVYLRILFENGEPRDAIYLEVNPAWKHWAGSRNVIGRKMSEVSPGFREMRPQPFERVIRVAVTGRSERFETYSTSLKKWLSISAYCPRKEHVIVVHDDITERKRAQDHLRLVIDTIPALAWSLRPDGVVDFLNKRWVDYSGLTLEQYVQDPTGPIHPEDIPRVLKKWRAALAAGESSEDEMRLRRADGEYRWFLVRTVPLRDEHGSVVKWLGASIDIDDRKETEEALRQSEERFAAFMDNLPGYAWMKDLQGRYVYINQVVRGLPGYGSLGKTDAQIWPADLAAEYRVNDQQVIAAKKPLHTVEHYLHEGKQRYMVGSKFPIFDKNGAVALVGGAGVDITERIEAEEALRESELRFRQLAENIQEIFWMTTPAMEELLYVSPAYENVWGRSLQSLRQRPQSWMDAIHTEDRERVVGVLEGRRQQGFEVEYRIVRPDGSVRWIRDRRFPVKDESGKVYRIAGIAEDTTERKRAEQTLRHSEERLRSVLEERERLSRDLHDNIVQSIYAIGMRLEQCLGQSPDNIAAQLAQVIEQLNGLIRDVRQYIKGPEQTVITGPELRAELLKQVKAIATAEGPLFEVELDSDAIAQLSPDEVEQVLHIAREALSNSMRHSHARRGTLALCLADGYVRLEIRDDGLGFDSRQPKQAGEGLRNMKLRAEEIAGKLEILSSPGSGTCVILDIPTK